MDTNNAPAFAPSVPGTVVTDIGGGIKYYDGYSATLQADGKIVVAGSSGDDLINGVVGGHDQLDGGAGTDTLLNIERAQFSDHTLTLQLFGETLISTDTGTALDGDSSITALADGGYVVTWRSLSQGSDGNSDIYAQRFDATGSTVGGNTLINTTTTAGEQYDPAITALADGGYVVTWVSLLQGSDGTRVGIYVQRFNAAGAAVEGETRINSIGDGYAHNQPDITALANGGYVVTWMSDMEDGYSFGIYARRFDATGDPVGFETHIDTTTAGYEESPAITALADGGYVVTWQSTQITADLEHNDIYAQRFNATGAAVGGETRVNTTTPTNYNHLLLKPAITALADGGYVVTWNSFSEGSNGYLDIYAQRFDATGSTVGGNTLINTTTVDNQAEPAITALADGGYVVTWISNLSGANWQGPYEYGEIIAQRFDAAGTPVGGETLINTRTYGFQFEPAITALADGGYVATWSSDSPYDIYAQRFDAACNPLTLRGDANNNTLYPILGSTQAVDGGLGIDTVVIDTTRAQMAVQGNSSGGFSVQRISDGATLNLAQVERLTFTDGQVALDVNSDGHAGQAVKLLGALGGPQLLTNKTLVGDVIRMLDSGYTSEALAEIGLQALGAQTPTKVVQLLWTNLIGRPASEQELQPLVELFSQGISGSQLALMASNSELNTTRIGLTGLAETGIDFL